MDLDVDPFAPIAGVSFAQFVSVSLELARVQFDASRSVEVAGELGIPTDRWAVAGPGWSDRLRTDERVASEFARRYHLGWGAA